MIVSQGQGKEDSQERKSQLEGMKRDRDQDLQVLGMEYRVRVK